MEFINGVTFGFMSQRGDWQTGSSRESLRLLKERCQADHVILAIVAEQDTAQSTMINWQDETVLSDQEVKGMIAHAHDLGLKVILKPMVNVSDGTWRAHINFFEHDVPPEPKWSEWFASYGEYINHYAQLAQETACQMLIIGCELVNTDRREKEWRQLIETVRSNYQGLISYNCDKYQENFIDWWDAVDVISSSGYYPMDRWEGELDRIEQVVKAFDKPFFFCEVGCPSRLNSEYLPNNWELNDGLSLEAQANWYQSMFQACERRPWVEGFGLWDWKAQLYDLEEACQNDDYALYGKPAERVVKNNFQQN
ncbi:1,4-beta-xylanase [Vagococcus sp. BWB3-3]|uniref:1,4-beta-xylanase n=1 Tax=Vagococcus allomyrinae TaxID=2794353 RepID=A0A940PE09_9ENTE|nr:1,4-beta-xylanase [Vagococcus allomyrinae]MBP1041093.1 1,4-beta-xylanase [Vagococcus allomyrinae]